MENYSSGRKCFKVILVDNNILFRNTVRKTLEEKCNCHILAEAGNFHDYNSLTCFDKANFIVINLLMPDFDVYKAALELTWNNPTIKVIGVTMYFENVSLVELIEKGFRACLSVNDFFEDILTAINTVEEGLYFFPKGINIRNNRNKG